MTKLKTLKDIEMYGFTINVVDWILDFFNLKEEEIE